TSVELPLPVDRISRLARIDHHPLDLALALARPATLGIEDPLRRAPDVRSRPIPLDERDDRTVRNAELAALHHDRLARVRDPRKPVAFAHFDPLPQGRSSIGVTFNPSGPTYSAFGRISRLSSSCSMMCAVHPAARAHA